MTSSSSSSSKSTARRSVHGVPKKCWCVKGLSIWASETKENSFRRFYRCEITLQRKSESHLFKWEDEAIPDEVSMVEAKVLDLVHDFQSLSKSVAQSIDEATRQFKEDMDATLNSNMKTTLLSNNGPVHNFGAAVGIVLAIACLYWKLL
ncbi:PREDICTED: uncharacterized protein At4g04775-like [Brassica oleracea var. oleracea]|uniref:uncharacterized protein At4g04775-like n=1 Tax=Brassica oleracea var. oleracea TaxID=109376 RepID=UPI0006A6ABDB|nr:PREDICTED: uncharacterized protein At4g04775-like [Brassica oleracea var. oleracea]